MNNLVLQVLARLQATELRDEEGQTLAEYGLILFLIAVACVIALGALSGAIQNVLNNTAGALN